MDQEQIDQFNQKQKDATEKQRLLDAVSQSALDISKTIVAAENHTKDVNITNDLAKPSDIEKVVQAVNAIDLKPQDLQPIADALDQVSQAIAKLPTEYPEFPGFPEAPEQREDVKVTNLSELKEYFGEVVTAVGNLQTSIKFDPKIEVKPADVTVNEKEVDLAPVVKGLASLEKAFRAIKTPNFDTSEIIGGLNKVSQTINGLSFPVPNYVLPFKDASGAAVQVQLDADGKIPVASAGGTGLTDTELRASPVPVSVSGVATAAAQTDGTQKIQIVDAGGDAVTVTGGKLDVNSAAPVGGATEAKQDSQITLATQLETLTETLQELVQRLAPLAGAMRNTAQLGVIGSVAVTSAPSTAVTGPITSAQSIAEKAVAGISYPEKVAITNLTAIQSNINNAVAA